MRRVLAIDTSTATGRIAIAAGETVLFASEFTSQRSHNSQIFSPLEAALDCCGRELDLVAVGTGPGSYTGVRIGIASGIAIAMALELPVIGIPSACAAAAAAAAGGAYTLIGDARRGATFLAEANGHQLESAPELIDDGQLSARLEKHKRALFSFDDKELPDTIMTQPSASKVAVLAACLDDGELDRLQELAPEPVYLREPFITLPKKPGKAVT